MSLTLDSLTVLPDPDNTVRDREKVKDLLPVAQKIQEAQKRVSFTLDADGANKELDRLRLAARIQGYSLRTVSNELSEDKKTRTVIVKPGKLIERETGKPENADDNTETTPEADAEAPTVTPTVATIKSPAKPTPKAGDAKPGK